MSKLNDFHYAQTLMEMLYGINLPDDEFEEIALLGWNLIGNKRTRLYRYSVCVDSCNQKIELPCNVEDIEAVTTDFEEWDYSTNDTPNGNTNSAFVESYIEARKAFRNPLYAPGKFIKYEQVGNTLYFDKPWGKINILYKDLMVDDEGLPEITDKEATALATYCAYITKFKEGISTNNSSIIQLSEVLRGKWITQCDQARADHYMTQNQWNEVLDAKTCWNRKQFGKSLKLYK